MGGLAPADDLSAEFVRHGGQIAPLAAHLEVGDVSNPHLVGTVDHHAQAAVGDGSKEGVVCRVRLVKVARPCPQAILPHQTRYALL